MDTTKFTGGTHECFPFLDLEAQFEFKTASSISFHVGRDEDVRLPEMPEHAFQVFRVIGWFDVHHPCDSVPRTRIRICMPVDYHEFECMQEMVKTICEALSIESPELCETDVFDSNHATGIIPPVYFGTPG